jgi:DNA primase
MRGWLNRRIGALPSVARIDLDAIRRNHPLPEIAAGVVVLRKAGTEWTACCPFHTDRSPSFTIFDGGRRFHCFGCGASGDVLDFVQRLHGVSLPEAARMLGAGDLPQVPLPVARAVEHVDRSTEARSIWDASAAAEGTLAEAYLRSRGITGRIPPDIRFSPLCCGFRGPMPCLVAAVRDVAGEVTGIQRIFLRADGLGKADMPKPKLSLGSVKGGAMRLGELGDGETLTVCEGPEDGLSLIEMGAPVVWVAAGATLLPSMQFPPQVRSVVIGADNDEAGRDAADKAVRAFVESRLSVRVICPSPGFKDFNDELRGGR